MDGFAHGGNMGAAELSQQDLGVSRAVAEGNEGAAPLRGLSLIKNTIRARATASRILEERALSSWQRVGRNGKCVCVHTHTSAGPPSSFLSLALDEDIRQAIY